MTTPSRYRVILNRSSGNETFDTKELDPEVVHTSRGVVQDITGTTPYMEVKELVTWVTELRGSGFYSNSNKELFELKLH